MTSVARLRHDFHSERGSVLPLAMIAMLLFSVLGFTLVAMGTTELTISGSWKQYSAAFYGAEAGIESGVVALRGLIAGTPTPTNAELAAIIAPTLPDPKLNFTTFAVTRVVPAPPYSYPTTFTTGPYAGFSGQVTDYLITSEVRGDNSTKSRQTQIIRYVQVPLESLIWGLLPHGVALSRLMRRKMLPAAVIVESKSSDAPAPT